MKCHTVIGEEHEEGVWIFAKERTPLVEEIERLTAGEAAELIGYREREIARLDPADVYCFTVEDGRLYAVTEAEKWQLRVRLYQVEGTLGADFVKINQSCIANIRHIKRFEVSFAGALLVVFRNGHRDYVSRRQLKTVKERIGFHL